MQPEIRLRATGRDRRRLFVNKVAEGGAILAAALAILVLAIVLWSVVVDGHNVTTRGGPIRAGDIILLHYRKNLLAGVQTVIDQAHRRGLRFAHLEDYLLSHPPPQPRPTPSEPPPEPPPPSCAPLPVCL